MAGKCANCTKCRIYIEGPAKGRCIYGGPFIGYRRYDVATDTYGPVYSDPPHE